MLHVLVLKKYEYGHYQKTITALLYEKVYRVAAYKIQETK
jgi:hypothetical protein